MLYMKSTKPILIILSILLAVFLAEAMTRFSLEFLSNFQLSEEIQNTWTASALLKFVMLARIQFAFYFFMLITLPLLMPWLLKRIPKEIKTSTAVLALEILGLVLAVLITPPDMVSTVLAFLAWQPVVLVNALMVYRFHIKHKRFIKDQGFPIKKKK